MSSLTENRRTRSLLALPRRNCFGGHGTCFFVFFSTWQKTAARGRVASSRSRWQGGTYLPCCPKRRNVYLSSSLLLWRKKAKWRIHGSYSVFFCQAETVRAKGPVSMSDKNITYSLPLPARVSYLTGQSAKLRVGVRQSKMLKRL